MRYLLKIVKVFIKLLYCLVFAGCYFYSLDDLYLSSMKEVGLMLYLKGDMMEAEPLFS